MLLKISRFLSLRHGRRVLCAASFLFCVVMCYGQQAKAAPSLPSRSIANFTDVAEKAGLTMQDVVGGLDTKKYIIETTGTGIAIFDYANDGWPDVFIVDGPNIDTSCPAGQSPN